MTDPRDEGQQADGSDPNTELQGDPSKDLDIRPEDVEHPADDDAAGFAACMGVHRLYHVGNPHVPHHSLKTTTERRAIGSELIQQELPDTAGRDSLE